MEINADVFALLTSLELFDLNINFTINERNNVILSERDTKTIKNGTFFIDFFEILNRMLNEVHGNIFKNDDKLTNLINDDEPAIKLKNWTILVETIKNYYGIIIENDKKTLLIAGDNETFLELFNHFYQFYVKIEEKQKTQRKNKEKAQNSLNESSNSISNKSRGVSANQTKQIKPFTPSIKLRYSQDIVNLDEINSIKPINATSNVLEFILVSLCKAFDMNIKQSAALLSENKKYFSHLVRKGVRSDFKPVKLFFQEILGNLDYFLGLIQIGSVITPNQISKNIEMSLSTFKFGLLSKDLDVVYLSGRLLTKLVYELIERNLISAAWEWFINPGGGLEACILSINSDDRAIDIIVTVLANFSRFHLLELFTVYLRNYLNSEASFLSFLADICEKLSNLKFFCDEFEKSSLKKFFMEFCEESAFSKNLNTLLHLINFITELWVNFSIYFEKEEENYKILNILKNLLRNEEKIIKISTITHLFYILETFAKQKHNFAPIIYKTLTFYLVEIHKENSLKELILSNFRNIFKSILSIPVSILMEPFIKQINVSLNESYSFNMIDINFLIIVAIHPRLTIKDGIIILDVLGKVYFENVFFYKVIKTVFTLFLSRYLFHEMGVEFCFKYVKLMIEVFCSLDKENSEKIFLFALKQSKNPENVKNLIKNEDYYEEIVENLTKAVIIEMIRDILGINNGFVNSVVKGLLIAADLRHFRVYNFHNLGLGKALEFFGNAGDVVQYYNLNYEELDVDREFEMRIERIFDAAPVQKIEQLDLMELQDNNNNTIDEQGNKDKQLSGVKSKANLSSNSRRSRVQKDLDSIRAKKAQKQAALKQDSSSKQLGFDGIPQSTSNNRSLAKPPILKPPNNKSFNINSNNIYSNKLNPNIYYEGYSNLHTQSYNVLNNNYLLWDLTQEEDRDIILLKKLLKDYNRFFRFIFMKYCGSIYHPIQGKLFSALKEITETISPSEIVKMFREHDITPKYILKEEIFLLCGLMNLKVFGKQNSKSGLNFNEFIEIFLQFSFLIFNRPPFNHFSFTITEFVLELIKLFRKSAYDRSLKNLVEYEHPDNLLTNAEKEICENLNEKLKFNNFLMIPENFKKFLDTEIKEYFYVPECIYKILGESHKIVIDILDEIIFKAVGFHFLESFVRVREIYKVRPLLSKTISEKNENEERFKRMMKNFKKIPPLNIEKLKKNEKIEKNTKIKENFKEKPRKIENLLIYDKKKFKDEKMEEEEIKAIFDEVENDLNNDSFNEEDEKLKEILETNNNLNISTKRAISNKKPNISILSNTSKTKKPEILNKLKITKIIEEEKIKMFEKEQERKRKQRMQFIKNKLDKYREEHKDDKSKILSEIKETVKKKK